LQPIDYRGGRRGRSVLAAPPLRQTKVLQLLQALPRRLPGKMRLVRRLLSGTTGSATIACRNGLRFAVPNVQEPLACALAANGCYEPENVELLCGWLRDGGDFIDVGANVGSIALPVAKRMPHGRALLVEAWPQIVDYLAHNVADSGLTNALIAACLCGEREMSAVPFWQAPDHAFGQGSRGAQFHREPQSLVMHTLDALVADHALNKVRALKVDVEGYEREVFEGAQKLLTQQRPNVLFEFMDWAEVRRPDKDIGGAQRALMNLDYRIYTRMAYCRGDAALHKPRLFGSDDLVAIPREKC
jgi:FkbM family methyltransferase